MKIKKIILWINNYITIYLKANKKSYVINVVQI